MSNMAPLPVAELSDRERVSCLRLARCESVGPASFRNLINRHGTAEAALAALPGLARKGGRTQPLRIPTQSEVEDELAAATAVGAQPLFTIEPGYPKLLALLDLPPPMIYVRGRTELLNQAAVAIVGSRAASAAGLTFARQIAAELSDAGLVIVSGLARGIDGAAHHASLSKGTVAVLAGGVDVVYPPEHQTLYDAIVVEGCAVSEHPPGLRARGKDFPRRNRLISGMSLGVVIVEAVERSGSLVTARCAGEQGREVFAVPGHPLDPRASGTNGLIREGATLTTRADDVLAALRPMMGMDAEGFREPNPASPIEVASIAASDRAGCAAEPTGTEAIVDNVERVAALLGPAPVHIDDLARGANISARELQIVLLELSLAGRLEYHGGQLVSLKPTPKSSP